MKRYLHSQAKVRGRTGGPVLAVVRQNHSVPAKEGVEGEPFQECGARQ